VASLSGQRSAMSQFLKILLLGRIQTFHAAQFTFQDGELPYERHIDHMHHHVDLAIDPAAEFGPPGPRLMRRAEHRDHHAALFAQPAAGTGSTSSTTTRPTTTSSKTTSSTTKSSTTGSSTKTTSKATPQDCRWDKWSDWSACTKSCARGTRTRTRQVAQQLANGGKDCKGRSQNMESCNEQSCPVDCVWGDWNKWSSCSSSCGNGTATRSRKVRKAAVGTGKACLGLTYEEGLCKGTSCVQARDMVQKGAATQLTGVVELKVKDPVSFAMETRNKQVILDLLRNISGYDAPGLHVSLIPQSDRGFTTFKAQLDRIDAWFSLLLNVTSDTKKDDSTSRSFVSRLCEQDTSRLSWVLRNEIRHEGVMPVEDIPNASVVTLNASVGVYRCSAGTTTTTTSSIIANIGAVKISQGAEKREPVVNVTAKAPAVISSNITSFNGTVKTEKINGTIVQTVTINNRTVELVPTDNGTVVGVVRPRSRGQLSDERRPSNETLLKRSNASIPEVITGLPVVVGNKTVVEPLKVVNGTLQPVDGKPVAIAEGTAPPMKGRRLAAISTGGSTTTPQMVVKPATITVTSSWVRIGGPVERITGIIKLTRTKPAAFCEAPQGSLAIGAAISQLTSIPQDRIRVSMMPSKEDPDAEIDAWFSIQIPGQNQSDAVFYAQPILQKFLLLDLATVDAAVQSSLTSGMVTDTVKVTGIVARLTSNAAAAPLDTKSMLTVTGVVEVSVGVPRAFAADNRAEQAFRVALNGITAVPSERIQVSLIPKEDRAAVLNSTSLRVQAWYTLQLPDTDTELPKKIAEKVVGQNLRQLGVAIQDQIDQQGMSATVQVTAVSAAPGSVSADAGTPSGRGLAAVKTAADYRSSTHRAAQGVVVAFAAAVLAL
jgi:hypothetical protein